MVGGEIRRAVGVGLHSFDSVASDELKFSSMHSIIIPSFSHFFGKKNMIFIEISRALTYDKCLPSILFNLVMNPMKGSYCSILQMRAQGQRGQINFPMSII